MADEYTVDHRSTDEDFLRVLSLGEGIDVDNFDRVSVRPKRKLFEETQTKDAVLKYNSSTGRVERHARSVRTRIYELQLHKIWLEVARGYPGGKVVSQKKDFTTSETLKPWETGLDGAVRCNLEEMKHVWNRLGYWPKARELTPVLGRAEPDVHESSVYEGVLSIVKIDWFDLYLDFHKPGLSLGEEIIVVKDANGAEPDNENWVNTYIRAEHDAR